MSDHKRQLALAAVVDAVTAAIKSGRLPRAQAEASALRVLGLKRKAGLAPSAQ